MVEKVINRLAVDTPISKITEVYSWFNKLIEDNYNDDAVLNCLKEKEWVAAEKNITLSLLSPQDILLSDASPILKYSFYVPVVNIPENVKQLDLGFMKSLPKDIESLINTCNAILNSQDADEKSFIALYEMITEMITDGELKEKWTKLAREYRLIYTFRKENSFSTLNGLFIGDEKHKDDYSNKLLCLNKEKNLKRINEIYTQLGVELLPGANHFYYALTEFDENGTLKEYRILVESIVRNNRDLASEFDLGKIKILTLEKTFQEIKDCFYSPSSVECSSVSEGKHAIINHQNKSVEQLISWIKNIDPYYPKTLYHLDEITVDVEEDPGLYQQYQSMFDPWKLLLENLKDDDSKLIEELKQIHESMSSINIELRAVDSLASKAYDGGINITISDKEDAWCCHIDKKHGILYVKPAELTDYSSLDKIITKELILLLSPLTSKETEDSLFSILEKNLERPSAILDKIAEDKRNALLSLYLNEVADPQFKEKYDEYSNLSSGSLKHKSLREELLDIVYKKYIEQRKNTIIGHGYDKTSIVAELLQNAEDAYKQADFLGIDLLENPYFTVILSNQDDDKYLSVEHEGRPFNYYCHNGKTDYSYKHDIEGVLRSSGSFKPYASIESNTSGTIGKFGLGFKSVYLITDCPVIHSGHWHFCIKNACIPEEIPAPDDWSPEKTMIKLSAINNFTDDEIDTDSVWKLLPFLVYISEIRVMNGSRKSVYRCIERNTSAFDDIKITYNEIENNNSILCRFFKISQGHTQVAMLVDEEKNPVKWLEKFEADCYSYLPLNSKINFGFAVSDLFSIQSGRTHLLTAERNEEYFKQIGKLIIPLVKYLTQHYEGDNTFWKGFWSLFESEYQSEEIKPLTQEFAVSLLKSAQNLPCVPTISDVVSLTEPNQVYCFACNISPTIRKEIMISGLKVNEITVNSNNTIAIETYAFLRSVYDIAEIFDELYVEELNIYMLIEMFKSQNLLAINPHILNTIVECDRSYEWMHCGAWLSECKVLVYGNNDFDYTSNLFVQDMAGIEYLPSNKMRIISVDYNHEAISILLDHGLKDKPNAADLICWIESKELLTDECRDLLTYLYHEKRYSKYLDCQHFVDLIKSNWIPFNDAFISPVEYIDHNEDLNDMKQDLTFYAFLGFSQATGTEPTQPSKNEDIAHYDAKAILNNIYEWWEREHKIQTEKYNELIYPNSFELFEVKSKLNHEKHKLEWLKLLLLGSLQTIGRTKPEQHKKYLEKHSITGLFDEENSAEDREKKLLETIYRILDDPNDEQKYYHWAGLSSIRFFQFNRWLDEYIDVFMDINRLDEPLNIEAFKSPNTNPIYSGKGIEAPSMKKTFGKIGVHFVLRELVRNNIITNDLVHPHCFPPAKRMRGLFEKISNGLYFNSSSEIMSFLEDNLKGRDYSFKRCFDIPFEIILRDKSLEYKFIGLSEKDYEDINGDDEHDED